MVISGSTNQNCQYGGPFILRHMNNQSTYICEHIQNYTIYNDNNFMVIFLVWYSGYSSLRLDAQLSETACFTRYTAHRDILTSSMENTLDVSGSLPCQLIICTPLMSRKNSKYCTINTTSQSSIGTADISHSLHKCSQVDTDIHFFIIHVNYTENWPFDKSKNLSIRRSSLEKFHSFYPYLNRMQIILPYICSKLGSMKQMSAKIQISMCKITDRGILRNSLFDTHPLTSECSNIKMTKKYVFKSHPHSNTASRKLTVIQKEGKQKYAGVYISDDYVECADECRNFIYTLTVLNK